MGFQWAKSSFHFTPLSASPTEWSNSQKSTNCLNVFDHFMGLALKWLSLPNISREIIVSLSLIDYLGDVKPTTFQKVIIS